MARSEARGISAAPASVPSRFLPCFYLARCANLRMAKLFRKIGRAGDALTAMKAITWLAAVTVTSALTASAFATPLTGWSEDLEKGIAKAKKEKKAVLVEFTGSDWCPPCIAMRKNVFSLPEFVKAASAKYVLVELDFPKGDKALAEKNKPLMEKYKIEGFPTVVLLDGEGKEFDRFTASKYLKSEDFLKHLDEALEKKD